MPLLEIPFVELVFRGSKGLHGHLLGSPVMLAPETAKLATVSLEFADDESSVQP